MSHQLPNEVSLIFNHSDCEPEYGKYSDKNQILGFLSEYEAEIVSDTFIGIGIIFHSDYELIEIFVPESKYIKFWGVDQESFLKVMSNLTLKKLMGLNL